MCFDQYTSKYMNMNEPHVQLNGNGVIIQFFLETLLPSESDLT
jgi:hypothetical protein